MEIAFAATLVIALSGGPKAYEFATDAAGIRSEAIDLLVGQLADPKKGRAAARRLVRFGRRAVPALRRALSSRNLRARFYAASVLALIADPGATRMLLRVLADEKESPLIRRIAAGAMSRAGHRESIQVLVRLARRAYPPGNGGRPGRDGDAGDVDDDTDGTDDAHGGPLAGGAGEPFRYEVVKALAYMGAAAADDIVTAALSDPSPRIRRVAAQGLGDHRVRAAIPALREALHDPDAGVVAEAAKALGKFVRLAVPATEELIGLLEHNDARVRRAAGGALVLATGNSFSTPEKWRAWWRRRVQAREERLRGRKAEAESAVEAEETGPLPIERPEREKGAPSSPSSSGPGPGGTPPALRMPWEWDDEDRTKTPEP